MLCKSDSFALWMKLPSARTDLRYQGQWPLIKLCNTLFVEVWFWFWLGFFGVFVCSVLVLFWFGFCIYLVWFFVCFGLGCLFFPSILFPPAS